MSLHALCCGDHSGIPAFCDGPGSSIRLGFHRERMTTPPWSLGDRHDPRAGRRDGWRGVKESQHLRHIGADRPARVAVAGACLRAQFSVTSAVKANSFSSRPYRLIRSAKRYRSERPHLAHSTRSTSSLPIRSEKMIAPSRGTKSEPSAKEP
jgi:hypothetical protein